jgi:hypothetical protein
MFKNIFFLFPPGYSGTYLQWILNISENSKQHSTTKNPLLPNGTSHGFIRRPTHTGSLNILSWIVKNQPGDPQTFAVYANTNTESYIDHPANTAYRFLRSYPDALFINIYAKTPDEMKIGALNGYTKWNTWIYDQVAFNPNHNYNFDWDGGKTNLVSLHDRNWLFENWRNMFPSNTTPFNWEEFKYNIDCFKQWFAGRKLREPQETDSQQFNDFAQFPDAQIYDISLGEIYSDDLFESNKLFSWIESQQAGDFDWDYAKQYHKTYIDAQQNLKWVHHISDTRKHKQVSQWLLRNSFCQALLLEEIAEQLDDLPEWQTHSTEKIIKDLGYTVVI